MLIPVLAPNTLLQGRYRVVRHLGQGGMGTVYEAVDQRLETIVAVKESHLSDPQLVKQFTLEARLLAKLRHPALTKVIDHFEEAGAQFLVMEYIPGPDLATLLTEQNGPFPVAQVMNWADQLLNALNYLHTQTPPIIHRDIKPQNLKLTTEDQIILLDFGLAKGAAGGVSKVASVYGYTPTYAPLEQIQGTGTEPRSDLYALAATLYQLLTNVSPPDALTRVMDITNELPDPLIPADKVNSAIPAGLSGALAQALHLNREKRPATALAMRELLRQTPNRTIAAEEDPQKTLVLPPSASTAETLQMPSGTQPFTEAATVERVRTEPLPRDTVRDPALAGFMQGEYEPERRSWFPVVLLALLGILALGGLGYGAYRLITGSSNSTQSQNNPPFQAEPGASPVGGTVPPGSETPGPEVTDPKIGPTEAGPTPTPEPTAGSTPPATATPAPTVAPTPPPSITPPPRPTGPIRGGVLNGKATYLAKPAYPPMAKATGASGQVVVQVLIDESGNVISASAVSGHALLRQSAVNAAKSSRFSPTLLSGVPVKVSGSIVYNFVAER